MTVGVDMRLLLLLLLLVLVLNLDDNDDGDGGGGDDDVDASRARILAAAAAVVAFAAFPHDHGPGGGAAAADADADDAAGEKLRRINPERRPDCCRITRSILNNRYEIRAVLSEWVVQGVQCSCVDANQTSQLTNLQNNTTTLR
jgi:hypothetical protein